MTVYRLVKKEEELVEEPIDFPVYVNVDTKDFWHELDHCRETWKKAEQENKDVLDNNR